MSFSKSTNDLIGHNELKVLHFGYLVFLNMEIIGTIMV